jgi:hypothetical protein
MFLVFSYIHVSVFFFLNKLIIACVVHNGIVLLWINLNIPYFTQNGYGSKSQMPFVFIKYTSGYGEEDIA